VEGKQQHISSRAALNNIVLFVQIGLYSIAFGFSWGPIGTQPTHYPFCAFIQMKFDLLGWRIDFVLPLCDFLVSLIHRQILVPPMHAV
jgi:hypothetical protein